MVKFKIQTIYTSVCCDLVLDAGFGAEMQDYDNVSEL